jgi:ribonucleoside-triphosphate reductase
MNNNYSDKRNSYLIELLPKVYRTEGDIVDFKPEKIKESLIKETNLDENSAEKITKLAVRRIISSGMDFLSGPHIREIVCSILSEQHFEKERKIYTRIGMPLMDYHLILQEPQKKKNLLSINPESIHHWAANRISEEYAHLRILDGEQSKAHLYGDIHIHGLRYFDLRPNSQIWDPRMILKNGLPPVSDWSHCNKSGPASNLKVAVAQLSKWLGMTQGEFSGRQGFNFLSIFLAPYVQELSDDKLLEIIRHLIFEINQLGIIIGRKIPDTLISTTPYIFEQVADLPAIGPYGKEVGIYSNYETECQRLFKIFSEVLIEGDYNSEPFTNPKHIVFYEKEMIKKEENQYLGIWDEVINSQSPYFANLSQNSSLQHILKKPSYINYGTLQNVTINLPRLSYKSNSETEFFDLLQDTLRLCAEILLKKYEIIEKRIKSRHLPLCSGNINGSRLLDLQYQNLGISIVGLNQAIYNLTGSNLKDEESAFRLGKEILDFINSSCESYTKKLDKNFLLLENFSKGLNQRFRDLDARHFKDKIKDFSGINAHQTLKEYLNSARLQKTIDIKKHQILQKQAVLGAYISEFLIPLRVNTKEDFKDALTDFLRQLDFSCVQFRV